MLSPPHSIPTLNPHPNRKVSQESLHKKDIELDAERKKLKSVLKKSEQVRRVRLRGEGERGEGEGDGEGDGDGENEGEGEGEGGRM